MALKRLKNANEDSNLTGRDKTWDNALPALQEPKMSKKYFGNCWSQVRPRAADVPGIHHLQTEWSLRPGEARPPPRWGCSQLFCSHSCPSSGRGVLPWAAQEGLSSHILQHGARGRAGSARGALPSPGGCGAWTALGLRASLVKSLSFGVLLPKISYYHYRARGCAKNLEWHHWALNAQSVFWRYAGGYCQKHLWMFLAFRNFLTDPNTPIGPTVSVKKPTVVRVLFSTYSIYHIPEEKINIQVKSLLVCSLFQAVSSAHKTTFFISKNKIGHTQRNETYLGNAFLKTKK